MPPADGDTVVLAGGDYTVPSTLIVTKRISIEGATTAPPTRLIGGFVGSTLSYTGNTTPIPVHITDIQLTNQLNSGTALSFINQSATEFVVDRVRAEASGSSTRAISFGQTSAGSGIVLRNSVARTTGVDGVALYAGGPFKTTAALDIRNVVADSRGGGPNSAGLRLVGGGDAITFCGNVTAIVRNVYARSSQGPARDLDAVASLPSCAVAIQSSHSNWRDKTLEPGGSVSSDSDQHTSDALFADAAAGDYHQLAGSPTIDAGVADALIGAQDFDHEARAQGPAPDIGADESPAAAILDKTAPLGSALAFSPSGFVPDSGKSSITRKKKKRKPGTTVSYKLSEAGTVAFTVERKVKGRKQGKKCKTKRKKGKRCTIYKSVKGSFSRASTTGANSFHFTGVVGGKKLKRGSYRMIGTPTDTAGNKGAVFNGAFKILKGGGR